MIERRKTPRHRHHLNEPPHSPPGWMLPMFLLAVALIVSVAFSAVRT